MKIREITENAKCKNGWQLPFQQRVLPGQLGIIVVGVRLNDMCQKEEILMNYHNQKINVNDDNIVCGIRMNKREILEFDYSSYPQGNKININRNQVEERFHQMVNSYLIAISRGLMESKMIDDVLRKKIELGGLRALSPESSKMVHDLIEDFCKSLESQDEHISEDFEPGTASGRALDAIPTPDPKKKKESKKEVAKRKIEGTPKPR